MVRVGVDIGGTFTDVVLMGQDGQLATRKVSSTTDDYGRGILAGVGELLEELRIDPRAVEEVVHGTTVATNAILEGRGARTALITTHGFRDVLELRRIRIPELYDLFYEKPPPLVPRRRRFEVAERLGPHGEVRRPLDPSSVDEMVERVRASGAEAVAIALLHSYVNPSHERAVAEALRTALPDVYLTCSADLLPEIREYERTSTTVVNAYVGPIVRRYLQRLGDELAGIGVAAPLLVMQSNGASMSAELAIEQPAHIIESGPAAGVTAAAALGRSTGYPNLITLDMGGTTAKASIVEAGELSRSSEYEVGGGINLSSLLVKGGGYALKLPQIDVSEIGAGGGSIVWIDAGGLLRVGPQSAGAQPGPVCYDAGGTEPTMTDASVVLGYLNPAYLAGGRVRLNAPKAARVLDERIAARLELPLLEAAHGVFSLAATSMVRAVKAVSTYRGRDPRDFTLLAFGGNGPLFAVEMARLLEMRRIVVPPAPGLFSAVGLLLADLEHHLVQTVFARADGLDCELLNATYARLEEQARRVLGREGYAPERVEVQRQADLRYSGQAYELTVSVPEGPLGPTEVAALVEAFGQEHLRTYGHRAAGDPVDLINVRVIGRGLPTSPRGYQPALAMRRAEPERKQRLAYFGRERGQLNTPILERADLRAGPCSGPLIVEEYDATCLVPPDSRASLDRFGNIVVEVLP